MSDIVKYEMSDLEKFKQMDVEEIFKKTYITPKIIQCLKEENFGHLCSRNRALGFISIIERQFGLDLSELREKAEQCLEDGSDYHSSLGIHKKDSRKPIYIIGKIIFLILLAGGGYYLYTQMQNKEALEESQQEFFSSSQSLASVSSSHVSSISKVDNVAVSKKVVKDDAKKEDAKKEIANKTIQTAETAKNQKVQNVQIASNMLVQEHTELSSSSQINSSQNAIVPKITIIPKQKVWIGIIYLDNYQRKQFLTSSPIELNTSRDQLIITGHGQLQIDVNGKIEDFNSVKKMRFLYRAGVLEVIDRKATRLYNKGKDW